MDDPQLIESIKKGVAQALGLNAQDINLCQDEKIARVEGKTIEKFDFPKNSEYFICFEKCIFKVDISIYTTTNLSLHFEESHIQSIAISHAKIQELQIKFSYIYGSILITEHNHFNNIVLQRCTFYNRFEIGSTRVLDSFFATNNHFENAPFVLSDSNFEGMCILRENTFYGVEVRLCTFRLNLDFSLSELCSPLMFIGNKISDGQLVIFHFAKAFFYFNDLKKWIQEANKKIEILPNPVPYSCFIKHSTPILDTTDSANQYFLESNSCPKTLLQTYQETTINIKRILNNNGNIIESSSWHTQSLYCKEIELDSKPKKTTKEWIDWFQLFFYRLTSDHHTDLFRIISWMMIAIGFFGIIYFGAKSIQNPSLIDLFNPYGMALSLAGIVCLGIFWIMGYFQKIFFFAGIGLISTLWIACCKPTLIFGAMNLIDKAPRSGLENLLLVLYTLVMILLLFSLQKTARKNSIVPN